MDKRDICSSMEQSTWQEQRHVAGMRISPRPRCSQEDGPERRVLRYSIASWRIILPCLSMQWNKPRKKRPSSTPTSIRRNSSFLSFVTSSELLAPEPSSGDDPSIALFTYHSLLKSTILCKLVCVYGLPFHSFVSRNLCQ